MTSADILRDLAARPLQALGMFLPAADPSVLNAHPGGHPNSPAWLIWHAAREMDLQAAEIADRQQTWVTGDFASRFGIPAGADDIGFGHSPEQAERIRVTEDDAGRQALHGYLEAVTQQVDDDLAGMGEEDLSRVLDSSYDPPVTVAVRLVSAFDDAAQHIGQAAYVLGMPEPGR